MASGFVVKLDFLGWSASNVCHGQARKSFMQHAVMSPPATSITRRAPLACGRGTRFESRDHTQRNMLTHRSTPPHTMLDNVSGGS